MSKGPGVLQRRLLELLEAAAIKIQSAQQLIAAVLCEDQAAAVLRGDYRPKGEIAALNVASAVRRALRSLEQRKLVHRVHGSRYPENYAVYELGPPAPTRTITIIRGVEKPLVAPILPAGVRGEDGELQWVDHPAGFPPAGRRR